MTAGLLARGRVEVWIASLDVDPTCVGALTECLSADEVERAHRFRDVSLARRFRIQRGIVRQLCARYMRIEPADLTFATLANGKPILCAPGPPPLHFNVSHAGDLLLAAFRRDGAIGVDCEEKRPLAGAEVDAIAARLFASGERAALAQLPANRRLAAFYACWTCKEAYVKATGEGIAAGLSRFEVAVAPAVPRFVHIDGDHAEATRWTLRPIELGPCHVGAVATRAAAIDVVLRHWPCDLSSSAWG